MGPDRGDADATLRQNTIRYDTIRYIYVRSKDDDMASLCSPAHGTETKK